MLPYHMNTALDGLDTE